MLTHPAFLAEAGHEKHGSPTFRGLFVRDNLLCQTIEDPPPGVPDSIPVDNSQTKKTTRDKYNVHLSNTSCIRCHNFIDPIGFGFESFDAIGHYRVEENGVSVDTSGEIHGTQDINGAFNGPVELGQILSESREVSDCVSLNFVKYVSGRAASESEQCAISSFQENFSKSNTNFRELLNSVLLSDQFRYRTN